MNPAGEQSSLGVLADVRTTVALVLCPMRSYTDVCVECARRNCAWWNRESEECSVLTIALQVTRACEME